jgi:hypothetical protein
MLVSICLSLHFHIIKLIFLETLESFPIDLKMPILSPVGSPGGFYFKIKPILSISRSVDTHISHGYRMSTILFMWEIKRSTIFQVSGKEDVSTSLAISMEKAPNVSRWRAVQEM